MITSVELMRFYLCINDLLSRRLFLGEWSDLICYPETIELRDNDIAGGLKPIKGLDRHSAFHLAGFLLSEEMRREVNHVFQAVQVGEGKKTAPVIASQFLFSGKTTLEFTYRAIRFTAPDGDSEEKPKWRRFVTKIHFCWHPFPFQYCRAHPQIHPEQGKNKYDVTLPPMNLSPTGAKSTPPGGGGDGVFKNDKADKGG